MNRIQTAYRKLNSHFPTQFLYLWYRGKRISRHDFAKLNAHNKTIEQIQQLDT